MSNKINDIKIHYNTNYDKILRSKQIYKYYHNLIKDYFKFNILSESSVLEIGCGNGDLLNYVNPKYGVGIDISDKFISIAKTKYPKLNFYNKSLENLNLDLKFDYIIISGLIGELEDIEDFLIKLKKFCSIETKIIVSYYNKNWEPILKVAELLKLKTSQPNQNWISKNDLKNILFLSDYEIIKHYNKIILPLKIPIISNFLNNIIANLPFFRIFCLISFACIKLNHNQDISNLITSIIVPAKNEKGNIENLIQRVKSFQYKFELIFVEGNSRDQTLEEMKRVQKINNNMDIKVIVQSGKGKGNAVREGFDISKGDILMILDADLSVSPEELNKFYRAIVKNKGGLINGSRFVYPKEKEAMRFLNMIGNIIFSKILSFAIDQKITDSLCGTKVLKKTDYLKIKQNRNFFGDFDPFGDFDLIFGSAKIGLKILDLPVRYQNRKYGKTQISRFTHGWLLIKMTIFALRKIKFN